MSILLQAQNYRFFAAPRAYSISANAKRFFHEFRRARTVDQRRRRLQGIYFRGDEIPFIARTSTLVDVDTDERTKPRRNLSVRIRDRCVLVRRINENGLRISIIDRDS